VPGHEAAAGPGPEILAAGAVVWRQAAGRTEVALVHRPKYDDWAFAKGKREPGEHLLRTAVREVAEETGLQVTLGRSLGASHYEVDGRPKRVDYWAARPASRGVTAPFQPNSEVDELIWLAEDDAAARLSYGRDMQLLAAFTAAPNDTVPLILLRHASAGDRRQWDGDDQARPLDAAGVAEASALADLLGCFGPARLISSPAERCLETLRPFAAATGSKIEVEELFGLGQPDSPETEAAVAQVAAAVAAEPVAAVICAHRENMPVLLEAACTRLAAAVPDGPPLRKAAFLVLHRAAGALVATERHDIRQDG
jgi:8-oxo-dGTP pyrophosphatase MutT (NUDIX family)/phosphohistidine phosphatase SixA